MPKKLMYNSEAMKSTLKSSILLSMAAIKQLRVGVIGAGYMAAEHLRAFAAFPDVELVGLHSRSTNRAEILARKYPNLSVFHSIEALYSQTKADLIIIAVSELACKKVCQEAFKYPWTLLIEKPVGHTLSEARLLESLEAKMSAKAYVAFNRRFYGSTLKLNNALEETDGRRVVTILDQEDPAKALAAGRPLEIVQN